MLSNGLCLFDPRINGVTKYTKIYGELAFAAAQITYDKRKKCRIGMWKRTERNEIFVAAFEKLC